VILPANPGMQFTPPPAFPTVVGSRNGGGGTQNSNAVDCEVR
jgi:hypothetical protein